MANWKLMARSGLLNAYKLVCELFVGCYNFYDIIERHFINGHYKGIYFPFLYPISGSWHVKWHLEREDWYWRNCIWFFKLSEKRSNFQGTFDRNEIQSSENLQRDCFIDLLLTHLEADTIPSILKTSRQGVQLYYSCWKLFLPLYRMLRRMT